MIVVTVAMTMAMDMVVVMVMVVGGTNDLFTVIANLTVHVADPV